jgi:Rieske Fe-S protein
MSSENIERVQLPLVDAGRRRFCLTAIGGMAVVAAGTVGYPIITFLSLPKTLGRKEEMEIPLDTLAEGAAVWGEHQGRQIVVVKVGGEIQAFDGACTHLGCIVQWDAASRTFKCPCHGAAFSSQGKPVAGPVNIPLRTVKFEVKNGVLKVS